MTKRDYKNSLKSIKTNAKYAKQDPTHRPIHSKDYSHLSEKDQLKMEKQDLKMKVKLQKQSLKEQYKRTKSKKQ